MKIFLLTTAVSSERNPWATSDFKRIERLSRLSTRSDHQVVSEPSRADIVLFCGSGSVYHSDVIRSDCFRRNKTRSMILDGSDVTLPLLPGLYASLQAGGAHVGLAYSGLPYVRVSENAALDVVNPISHETRYLYSFLGRRENSPALRGKVLSLSDDRSYLLNASTGQTDGGIDYALAIQNSKFILCPKGIGPSSWRIYEAMKAGRAPVVISDAWSPPEGFAWDCFSLRVAEKDVAQIPMILRANESRAVEMGLRARTEFNRHLSLDNCFGWICDRLEALRESIVSHNLTVCPSRWSRAVMSPVHRIPFLKEKGRGLIESCLPSEW